MTLHRNVNIVLIALLAAALAACGSPAATPSSSAPATIVATSAAPAPRSVNTPVPTQSAATATVEPTTAPAQPAPAADPHTAVANAMQAMLKAPPYHTETTITSDSGTTQISGDMILPDQMHVITQRSGKTTEMIVAGGKAYLKLNDKWTVSPLNVSDLMSSIMEGFSQNTTISNVQFVKPDTVDGEPTLVYQFDSQYAAQGIQVTAATTLWLSANTGLPVKLESDGEVSGVKSHTVQTIKYDPTITIQAPPVQ